jgi:hypothetical protein
MLAAVVGLLAVTITSGSAAGATSPNQVESPDGAWVVEVTTSGGLMGLGKGGVTVRSDGTVRCTAPLTACDAALRPDSTDGLRPLIVAFVTAELGTVATVRCHDCYITTITVQQRSSGSVTTYSWNDAESGGLPEPVKRLHAAVLAIGAQRR